MSMMRFSESTQLIASAKRDGEVEGNQSLQTERRAGQAHCIVGCVFSRILKSKGLVSLPYKIRMGADPR
jgi:hypothetical protein